MNHPHETEPTYEKIESLIESAEIDGETMICVFRCPKSLESVTAKISMKTANKDSILSNAKSTAQKQMARDLKRKALGAVSSVFGRGALGTVAKQVAGQSVDKVASRRHYTEDERRRAIVTAFSKAKVFVLDPRDNTYVHKSALNGSNPPTR